MKLTPIFLVLLFTLSLVLAANHDAAPPSLTNFQQVYGTVGGLASGSFQVRVQIGTQTFNTPVESNGRYGYSPVFYVTGTNGQPVKFFVVNAATGAATEVVVSPQVVYQNTDVRQVNLQFGTGSGSSGVGTSGETTGSGTSGNGRGSSSRGDSRTSGTPTTPAGACLQSWDCQLWSECQSGRQSRTCFRSDTCDQKLAARQVLSVTTISKPSESQACISEIVAERVCPPSSKRCLGNSLQECSSDGQRWTTLRSCAGGCNSISLTCNAVAAPVKKFPSIPLIPIIIAGAVLLVVGIGLTVFLVTKHQKKYEPVKSYILEAKGKGLSDAQIKSTLIGQGWDPEKVTRLVK